MVQKSLSGEHFAVHEQHNLPFPIHPPAKYNKADRVDLHMLEALDPLIYLPYPLFGMPIAANYLAMTVAVSLPPLIVGNPLSPEPHLK